MNRLTAYTCLGLISFTLVACHTKHRKHKHHGHGPVVTHTDHVPPAPAPVDNAPPPPYDDIDKDVWKFPDYNENDKADMYWDGTYWDGYVEGLQMENAVGKSIEDQ